MSRNKGQKLKFFATTAKGVEPVLVRELNHLGMKNVKEDAGGASFTGGLKSAYEANLWLRTANRVLMPLIEFGCRSEKELYEGVRQVDWRKHLSRNMTLAVDANVRDSNIKHSKYAALKTKDAIVDQLREKTGSRPDVNPADPDLRINVHIIKNRCTLSLDTSGDSLHKRGYRVSPVEASLKETLAAAIIEFTDWDAKSPLIDPMCGSGTIPIEAALRALNIAPGLLRKSFGFQRWLDFDEGAWNCLIEEAKGARKDELEAKIRGYDISARAISASMENAKAATVGKLIPFIKKEITECTPPPGPGIVIINPPYGERLGDKKKLEPLYKTIGDVFKQRCKGYTGYVFTGNLDLAKHIGLKASRRIVLYNGPIESRLLKFELY